MLICLVVVGKAKFLKNFEVNPSELHTLADVMANTKKVPEELFDRYGMKQWVQAEDVRKRFDFDSGEYKESRVRRLAMDARYQNCLIRINVISWWLLHG